jgi:hypothetical protein
MTLRNSNLYRDYKRARALKAWKKRGYAAPSPAQMKDCVLQRNGIEGATWVETGTYRGDTTLFLSTIASRVFSIEPAPALYRDAVERFKQLDRIKILNGVSEDILPGLLPDIAGDVCFWLDGHYSDGVTFQGKVDTPIVQELETIEKHLKRLGKVAVLVDDVRCFNPHLAQFAGYPALDYLVDWARRNALRWHIEHDIFVATNA